MDIAVMQLLNARLGGVLRRATGILWVATWRPTNAKNSELLFVCKKLPIWITIRGIRKNSGVQNYLWTQPSRGRTRGRRTHNKGKSASFHQWFDSNYSFFSHMVHTYLKRNSFLNFWSNSQWNSRKLNRPGKRNCPGKIIPTPRRKTYPSFRRNALRYYFLILAPSSAMESRNSRSPNRKKIEGDNGPFA